MSQSFRDQGPAGSRARDFALSGLLRFLVVAGETNTLDHDPALDSPSLVPVRRPACAHVTMDLRLNQRRIDGLGFCAQRHAHLPPGVFGTTCPAIVRPDPHPSIINQGLSSVDCIAECDAEGSSYPPLTRQTMDAQTVNATDSADRERIIAALSAN